MNTTNYITAQVDRSFLYMMAIYAIHGVLLHLFLMHPQFDCTKMSWNIVTIHITNGWTSSDARHSSSVHETQEQHVKIPGENSTEVWGDVSHYDDNIQKNLMMPSKLLHQPKLTRGATCDSLLSKLEVSYLTVVSCGSTIVKNINPGVLGIILGCMVFLLTFTDNINLS